jgi:hypothetical protein
MPQSAAMTVRFCRRWLEKASLYDDQTLDGAFDKFFSVFVAFNRLYSHVSLHSGQVIKGDQRQATDAFASTVGSRQLLTALGNNGGAADLATLAELIRPGGSFYLISDGTRDQPDLTRNRDLHQRLNDSSAATKVKAVLEYLYLVRCNMFHGSEGFRQHTAPDHSAGN